MAQTVGEVRKLSVRYSIRQRWMPHNKIEGEDMEKTLDTYIGLPYTIELTKDAKAGWFAKVKELPGCMSEGETAEEALRMLQEAKELWLEVAFEDGDDIPGPRSKND